MRQTRQVDELARAQIKLHLLLVVSTLLPRVILRRASTLIVGVDEANIIHGLNHKGVAVQFRGV